MSIALPPPLVGRQAQARALVTAAHKGRSVLVLGTSGIGKSALLEAVGPVLEEHALTIKLERLAPFGNFIREVFTGLWDAKALGSELKTDKPYVDLETDRKAWAKTNPNNETKAKSLVAALEVYAETATRATLVIDDVSSVTASVVPWLVELERVSTLVVATTPEALGKSGTKRFWKLLEEIRLSPLSARDSGELLDQLTTTYRLVVSEPGVYRNRVLTLAGGVPGELARIVKYLSPEDIIRSKEVLNVSQNFAEREERGIAIAPILIALSAFSIAWRYIARAQGNLDGYVLSGIVLAVFVISRMLLGRGLKPRSS